MLGKDTVLFVVDDTFVSAERIKNALNEDSGFLGIVVRSSELVNKLKLRTERPRRFLQMKVWKPISVFAHKFSEKIRIPREPFLCDVMSKKKVYNMLFRYAPAAIVVNDATIRYSLEEGIRRAGMNVRIFVYSDELGFDYSLIGESVNHYFVDNISVRDGIRDKGVPASAIDVNPLPVESEYFEDIDVGVAKQRIGFEPTKKLCVIRLGNGMPFETVESVRDTIFVTADATTTEKGAETGKESRPSETELFRAADFIAARFDSHTVKRAAALKKPLILICDGEKTEEEAEYLVAEGKAAVVKNGEELAALIEKAETGELALSFDDADPAAQDKVAARIKELICEAKIQ